MAAKRSSAHYGAARQDAKIELISEISGYLQYDAESLIRNYHPADQQVLDAIRRRIEPEIRM
jgi:hypothetical protein